MVSGLLRQRHFCRAGHLRLAGPAAEPGAAAACVLLCALVWEVLAPLWKPEAVGDPWDLLAYQAGGLVWLAVRRVKI